MERLDRSAQIEDKREIMFDNGKVIIPLNSECEISW